VLPLTTGLSLTAITTLPAQHGRDLAAN